MYYPYFPNYLSPKRKKNPFDLPEDPIKKQMPAADFAKAATVMPDSASYFQHMGAYLEGLTVDEQSQQFGPTPTSMIPAVELIDYKLHNRQPFTPPGTKLGFDMARSNAALAAPEAPDATTQIAGAMRKPPASMLTPASTPTQPRQPAQSAQPPTSGAPRFPQPGDPIPGWVHQLGEDVVNDFQDFVQYIKTASLKEQQEIALEFGIVAASFLPGAGDAIGVGADLAGLRHEENRNAVYLGLTLLGAVPFVPPFNRIRKIKRLIRTGAEKWRRRKGMRRANQNPPANVPANQFDDVASARNANVDTDRLVVQATELGRDVTQGTLNRLRSVLTASRQAITNGLSQMGLPPEIIAKLVNEAISAAFVEMAGQVIANAIAATNDNESSIDASDIGYEAIAGTVSGAIGTADLSKWRQLSWELFNAGTMEIMKSLYSERGKTMLQHLSEGQWAALESALNLGTTAAARTIFDRLENRAPRLRRLIPAMKHGAAAGASVAIVTTIRLIRDANQYDLSDIGSKSFETTRDVVQDLYGDRR